MSHGVAAGTLVRAAAAFDRGLAPLAARLHDVFSSACGRTAGRSAPTLVSCVLAAVDPDPMALFAAAAADGQERSAWLQPSEGLAMVGVGAAWTMQASGATQFAAVEAAWSALTASAVVLDHDAPRGCGPLLLGGFGFADTPARTPAWRGYEAAVVVLPEWLLTVTHEGAWLTASRVVPAGARPSVIAAEVARDWDRLIARLPQGGSAGGAAGAAATVPARGSLRIVASHPAADEWRAAVARMAGAVGRGRLDKVVLARQVEVEASTELEVPGVLVRLHEADPGSTTFAVGRGQRTFLGATPERLVRLEGRAFRSVAMAGSARRGADLAADDRLAAELLASDKEREEHTVVVDMLRGTLAPLADELLIPSRPHVERLRHLQHLVTPVEGRLCEPSGVLRLAALLHPTPAVGGMPRDLALELIAEEEHLERGWYAGPLGWLDRHGDGELVVALRCGLVEGRSATLLAGCGIVADSDPEREWQESTAKLLALGSALGGVEA